MAQLKAAKKAGQLRWAIVYATKEGWLYVIVKEVSIFDCDANRLFNEVMHSKSLFYVTKPLVKFIETSEYPIPKKWRDGKYLVKVKLLGIIPFAQQWIVIRTDEARCHLLDDGYSRLIKRWHHDIYVVEIGGNKVLYIDLVDIRAGLLTPFVYLYACVFYRHRQKRWRKLIANNWAYS